MEVYVQIPVIDFSSVLKHKALFLPGTKSVLFLPLQFKGSDLLTLLMLQKFA
jgi:hypothetical protein